MSHLYIGYVGLATHYNVSKTQLSRIILWLSFYHYVAIQLEPYNWFWTVQKQPKPIHLQAYVV